MEIPLIVLGLTILMVLIWLLISEKRILNRIEENIKNIGYIIPDSNEKYYELKYKIQLLTSGASIILVIGGFLGYNSVTSIKEDIQKDLQHYKVNLQKSDSLLSELDSNKIQIEKELKVSQEALRTSLHETSQLKVELLKLQKQFTPNMQTYIVKGIPYEAGKNPSEKYRVYYKDLKTVDGNSLPNFTTPPVTNIISKGVSRIILTENTTEYFEYATTSFLMLESDPEIKPTTSFDVLITKYK